MDHIDEAERGLPFTLPAPSVESPLSEKSDNLPDNPVDAQDDVTEEDTRSPRARLSVRRVFQLHKLRTRLIFLRRASEENESLKEGLAKFKHSTPESLPKGWPRVAAFLEKSDTFGIYRRFGNIHARLLLYHMTNITEMENQLMAMDERDKNGDDRAKQRLKKRDKEGRDPEKRKLIANIEEELEVYDSLLLTYQRLQSLDKTPADDHKEVFKWIWFNKPLCGGEYDWSFYHNDFISIIPPGRDRFVKAINSLPFWFRDTFLMKEDSTDENTRVSIFSGTRSRMVAKIIVIIFAVSVLFVPVIILLLVPLSAALMSVVVLLFIFTFSGMISLLTDAGIQEIFIGTATYCAVLVTFLGNLQDSSSTPSTQKA